MKADLRKSRQCRQPLKAMIEVAGINWRSDSCGKDQAPFLPSPPCKPLLLSLPFLVDVEHRHCHCGSLMVIRLFFVLGSTRHGLPSMRCNLAPTDRKPVHRSTSFHRSPRISPWRNPSATATVKSASWRFPLINRRQERANLLRRVRRDLRVRHLGGSARAAALRATRASRRAWLSPFLSTARQY